MLLGAEVALIFNETINPPVSRMSAAESIGVQFDTRTPIQMIRDLESKGIDISIYPPIMVTEEAQHDSLTPLSGISNQLTLLCNESGEYTFYKSDEHGFNNPLGIWSQDEIDLVVLGDSYAFGSCVDPEHNAIAHLRTIYDKTLNLGLPGGGPWEEYAVFREYVFHLKPKRLLWFYFEGNDLLNMVQFDSDQQMNSLLYKYIYEDYHQGLARRQKEVDLLVSQRIQAKLDVLEEKSSPMAVQKVWRAIYPVPSLQKIRVRARNLFKDCSRTISDDTFTTFEHILTETRKSVHSWGGELYFIYLPSATRYLNADSCWSKEQLSFIGYHDRIITTAQRGGLRIVDISKIFDDHDDALSLFPFRVYGHYNSEGYGVVGRSILSALALDN